MRASCTTPGATGRPDEALAIHRRLLPLHKALFCETSPAPAKYALSRLGPCTAEVRLPLVELVGARPRPRSMRRWWPSGLSN